MPVGGPRRNLHARQATRPRQVAISSTQALFVLLEGLESFLGSEGIEFIYYDHLSMWDHQRTYAGGLVKFLKGVDEGKATVTF
jgi:hypothetical protein